MAAVREKATHTTATSPHQLRLKPTVEQSRDIPWLAQNWGLLAVATIAVVTIVRSAGTTAISSRESSDFTPVAGQTLFSSIARSSGGMPHISVLPPSPSPSQRRRRASATLAEFRGRLLQAESGEEDVVGTSIVKYETQLELFMCNPTVISEGNDAYLVGAPQLTSALSRVQGLNQVDIREIVVTMTTAPSTGTDEYYKCDEIGMLQWHATIKYPAETATSLETTPAVMAAQANDYVAYSKTEFKTLLAAYINDEYTAATDTVDLSAKDIEVPVVGWIVTFPSEGASTQKAPAKGNSNGVIAGIQGDYALWSWWVWLIYALLLACSLLPICCIICRRRRNVKDLPQAQLETTRKGRHGDGLNKVYGPEWGITELDFDADYKNYHTPEMKVEYDSANKGVKSTGYQASRPGHQSVSGTAWMQEAGKRSEWHPSPSTDPSRDSAYSPAARRFDIDDEDTEENIERLRFKHPKYSFDMNSGDGGEMGRGGQTLAR